MGMRVLMVALGAGEGGGEPLHICLLSPRLWWRGKGRSSSTVIHHLPGACVLTPGGPGHHPTLLGLVQKQNEIMCLVPGMFLLSNPAGLKLVFLDFSCAETGA